MTIPLDPGAGGRSIGTDALEIGDIVVSTTPAWISRRIKEVTGSPVSHAMLYIGGGQVVESILEGVTLRSLGEAVKEATLAAAYRHPRLSSTQALRVRDAVGLNLGKGYDFAGIAGQAGFALDRAVLCLEADIECIRRVGTNNMRLERKDRFFCSELVADAFRQVGLPLTDTPPSWVSPDDIANLRIRGHLEYVGHLKG
jgi:uncharacterized protein YycO